jgi:hypothetical protein
MDIIDKYLVTFKISVEQPNGKIKHNKEMYLVTDVATPQEAANVAQELFKNCADEWQIESVKAQKIDDILSAKK